MKTNCKALKEVKLNNSLSVTVINYYDMYWLYTVAWNSNPLFGTSSQKKLTSQQHRKAAKKWALTQIRKLHDDALDLV
jgi:hypothetical protein